VQHQESRDKQEEPRDQLRQREGIAKPLPCVEEQQTQGALPGKEAIEPMRTRDAEGGPRDLSKPGRNDEEEDDSGDEFRGHGTLPPAFSPNMGCASPSGHETVRTDAPESD